jgi:ArsR family transcriptional regulator
MYMEIPDPIREDVARLGGLKKILLGVPDAGEAKRMSKAFKSLSDPSRLRILHILLIQPLCVCCLKEMLDISDSRLSYHLSRLKDSGLIEGRPEKNWIIYGPTDLARELIG